MSALETRMDGLLVESLRANGIPTITEAVAERQGIPISRVALFNMMPNQAMQATERQWAEEYCTDPGIAVEMDLAKFDNDCREGIDLATGEERSRTENLKRYTPMSEVKFPVSVLVITGDNLEVEPSPQGLSSRKRINKDEDTGPIDPIELDDIRYGDRLQEIVKFGEDNAAVTIVSCLASHFVLNYFHDLPKQTLSKKIVGVYPHEVLDDTDPLARGLGNTIYSPHSRWGNVSIDQIKDHNQEASDERQLKILAASPEVGWLILKETLPNGHIRVYLQGHPEYDTGDLKTEWVRDRETGLDLPANYFPNNDPSAPPINSWWSGARALNHNILRESCKIAANKSS